METDAAVGSNFFPRPAVTQVLEKRLNAFRCDYRQNVGLIGRKFSGKTSVLKNFLLNLQTDEILPVYVNIGRESLRAFLYKWMGAMLESVTGIHNMTTHNDLSRVARAAKREIPETFHQMRVVRAHLRRHAYEAALKDTLRLSAMVAQETGKKVLLVIDEFHRLKNFSVAHIFSIFGREIMTQKDTMYVMASSSSAAARHIFHEELALLFGNFEILELGPFDFSEVRDFIRHRFGSKEPAMSVQNFLMHITDGHPYYLNVLTERIKLMRAANISNRDDVSLFIDGLTEELFHPSGLLHMLFVHLLKSKTQGKGDGELVNVIAALASGHHKTGAISRVAGCGREEAKKWLKRLIELDLVASYGSFYVLTDVLFSFWIREVYLVNTRYFGLERQELASLFKQRVCYLMEGYCADEQKDVSERLVRLFRKFQNDIIMIEGKRLHCPKFEEIRNKPSNGRAFPVCAESPQGWWLTQIVRDRLTEEDVLRFVADGQGLPRRPGPRIMIALGGVDPNARLMAKEQKIALWNLRQLNQLFKLYDQPKVIL